MEDFAGLRVTFNDLADLKCGVQTAKGKYSIVEDENYIAKPKAGYRSYHLIIKHNGKPLELQFRTPNMTIWADWMHDRLYDHPEETKAKVGEQGFRALQKYAQEMSEYFEAVDEGRRAQLPQAPGVVNMVDGGMVPSHQLTKVSLQPLPNREHEKSVRKNSPRVRTSRQVSSRLAGTRL